ncbi:MAG: hypothetical protein QXV84_01835 [Conexivisphaerales archaeon]
MSPPTMQGLIFSVQLLVVLAVALFSYRGWRFLHSRTLAYVAWGFLSIGIGIALQILSLFLAPLEAQTLLVSGSTLQTIGFFLLALSHFYTVRRTSVLFIASPFLEIQITHPFLSTFEAVADSVAFFLLLYILAETIISFYKERAKMQLLPVVGFFLLTVSVYSRLFLSGFTTGTLFIDVTSLLGYAVLAGPVLMFAGGRGN